jgi:hypothetical protein
MIEEDTFSYAEDGGPSKVAMSRLADKRVLLIQG